MSLVRVPSRRVWGHSQRVGRALGEREAKLRVSTLWTWPAERIATRARGGDGSNGDTHYLVFPVPWVRVGALSLEEERASIPEDPISPLMGVLLAVEECAALTGGGRVTGSGHAGKASFYLEGAATPHGSCATLMALLTGEEEEGSRQYRWDTWRRPSDNSCRFVASANDDEEGRSLSCLRDCLSFIREVKGKTRTVLFGWKTVCSPPAFSNSL